MPGVVSRCIAIALAGCSVAGSAACKCPTVAGPTAPAGTVSATLAPGEFRYVDADTPSGTTQINLQFATNSTTVPLRIRQIDPSCVPTAGDSCAALAEQMLTPRPAGVLNFASGLQVKGARTRVVVQNMSAEETIAITLTVQPHRAGCT